jgi:hypothetical protein
LVPHDRSNIRGRVSKEVTNGSKTAVMEVIGFLDAHARVQRLVSVVKMTTVIEGCTIEEQHSVVRFFVGRRTRCKGFP